MSERAIDQTGATVSSVTVARRKAARANPKRRRRWLTRGLVVVVLAVGAVSIARGVKRKPISVDTVTVTRGTVEDEISSANAGEVMAEAKATVRAEMVGRVVSIRHPRGERVKSGELVIGLAPGDLDARLRQAQATLDAQRAQTAQADEHAAAARKTAERVRGLAERGAENVVAADDAAAQAHEAAAAANAAHAQVEQNQAAVQVSRVARWHADLLAPFDGMVADVLVHVGDEVPLGGDVFEIVDDSRLHVEATIDEADIGKVQLGQFAQLRLDALPNHPLEGVVVKLDPTVRKDEKGARTLRIEVDVKNLAKAIDAGLRPGMSANVDVRVASKTDVLTIPTNLIIGRGASRSVYILEAGIVHERPIQVGLSSWERTEVVSGLKVGDEVVSNLNEKNLGDGIPATRSVVERAP
jgi:HlyD family secretion protein